MRRQLLQSWEGVAQISVLPQCKVGLQVLPRRIFDRVLTESLSL